MLLHTVASIFPDGLLRCQSNGHRSCGTPCIAYLLTFVVLGCGPPPNQRLPISGSIDLGTTHIHSGTLRLEPSIGGGPAASTIITNDRFQFSPSDGPRRGTYRAIIQDKTAGNAGELSPTPKTKAELAEAASDELTEAFEEDRIWIHREVIVDDASTELVITINPDA